MGAYCWPRGVVAALSQTGEQTQSNPRALPSNGQTTVPQAHGFCYIYLESDPVKIAVEGVERFKKENHDLIIIDMSRQHKGICSL
ncbi:Signal recognition particle 54 kDa protein 1 [Camellia lanceoleosa]|uniref:Signal recognition particle 54 kDa protein 1 n=1 Tax=Camellia lanceoleosa TaxID=1840588 RepID=A0ACC0G2B1_9ERIC|nr:Signal recognition particle 54 kDa protein 1 [Camellia lanceoleosa]